MPSSALPILPTSTPTSRLDFLDGLRGLAALGVVVHHYLIAFYPTTLSGDPATTHLPGHWEAWLAASPILLNFRVCFFFVLSGLVLAESVARTPPGWRALLAQVVRRYVRLNIPIAVSVALAYGLLLTHSFYNQPAAAASNSVWLSEFWRWMPTFREFVGDALFGVLMRGEVLYNFALWTMMLEWRGSLLVLATLAIASGRPWRLACYAALGLACALGPVDGYYVAFLLGLGLHDAYRRPWRIVLTRRGRQLLVGGLLLLTAVLACYPQTEYQTAVTGPVYAWLHLPGLGQPQAVDFYHTLGAATLLAAVLLSSRLQRLAGLPWLRSLGKRAFSLYLLHFLLLGSGSAWLFVWLRVHYSYHVSTGLMLLLSSIVLAGLTEAFYRVVDIPSHLIARWSGRVVGAILSYVFRDKKASMPVQASAARPLPPA